MKSSSSSTTLGILSILDPDYTVRQIAPRVGVSIGTISVVMNHHRHDMSKSLGSCPTKLSESDIRHAIRHISSGKADTAIRAHKVLQVFTHQYFSVNNVRGIWNKLVWSLYWRQNSHFPQSITRSRDWTLQLHIKTGLWMTGRGWFGLIRLKSMGWGCMEGNGCRKSPGRSWMEGLLSLHSNLEEGLWWCGAVSPGIGVGMDAILMERWI